MYKIEIAETNIKIWKDYMKKYMKRMISHING